MTVSLSAVTIADQQPIKGSPKAKAMEPGKGSETKRSFSGNGEDDIVRLYLNIIAV